MVSIGKWLVITFLSYPRVRSKRFFVRVIRTFRLRMAQNLRTFKNIPGLDVSQEKRFLI